MYNDKQLRTEVLHLVQKTMPSSLRNLRRNGNMKASK
jgi:hypothetical protein